MPGILPSRSVPYKRTPISFLRHALHKHPLVNNYWYIITIEICINILQYINYWNKWKYINVLNGLPRWYSGEESTCQCRRETQETQVRSLGQEDPLQEEMATHSSILAWKIPGTEDPGGLQPVGSQSRSQLSMYAHTILNMWEFIFYGKTIIFYIQKCWLPILTPQTDSITYSRPSPSLRFLSCKTGVNL